MDNLTLSSIRPSIHQPPTQPLSSLLPVQTSDVIELSAPPPRLPPRGERPSDTEPSGGGLQRPCPPLPPAPPLPAREPLHAVGVCRHPTVAGTTCAMLPSAPPRRAPMHVVERTSPPLDQIVPLSQWPLPRGAGTSSAGGHGDKTHVMMEPQQQHRFTAATSVIVVPPSSVVVGQPAQPHTTAGNLYVDAPTLRRNFASHVVSATPGAVAAAATTSRPSGTNVAEPPGTTPATSSSTAVHHRVTPTVIVTQPTSSKPERFSDGKPGGLSSSSGTCRGGIICSRCGRCRCANCTAPHELPRRWIGDFECSFQRCVKVTSCLCCVEAIFYHCIDGGDEVIDDEGGGVGAADEPCACCERPSCCLRWTVMTALAGTLLPCLCCYCPLQCTIEGLAACYNACATPRGCRCQTGHQEASSSGGSTRGLLGESESSST